MLDILLKLEAVGVRSNTWDCGKITVQFWKEDASKVSTGAIVDAHKAVETKLETRRSATKSLENVVSKIKMLPGSWVRWLKYIRSCISWLIFDILACAATPVY